MGRPTGRSGGKGFRQGIVSPAPLPTQVVSNEEFVPHPQTAAQARVERLGLATPQLGLKDLEFMAMQAETLKVDAWKCYTGSCPVGFKQGWWMDDEKIAYPMLEQARKLNIPRICVHKGLPLGPVPEYNHPRDLIKAAKDFPDLQFLVYHSGLVTSASIDDTFAKTGAIPWTTEFCRLKETEPTIHNIYMELGATFGQLVTAHPAISAPICSDKLSRPLVSSMYCGERIRFGPGARNGR